jgi:hypothetical protein
MVVYTSTGDICMAEAGTDGQIVLYPQIRPTELTIVHGWGRSEEQEFLKHRQT